MWESIGWLLGGIWVGLAMVMAMGCLGPLWLVFALYARAAFLKSSWGLLLSVEVVYGLIKLAALVLDVTASQWDLEQPALAIRTRPELLATLYNIGFEHSFPNPDPRPNEFGDSVALVASSGWVREAFPFCQHA